MPHRVQSIYSKNPRAALVPRGDLDTSAIAVVHQDFVKSKSLEVGLARCVVLDVVDVANDVSEIHNARGF